jgi:hypothetical protein
LSDLIDAIAIEMAKLVQRDHGAAATVGTGHAKRMAVGFDAVMRGTPDQAAAPRVLASKVKNPDQSIYAGFVQQYPKPA